MQDGVDQALCLGLAERGPIESGLLFVQPMMLSVQRCAHALVGVLTSKRGVLGDDREHEGVPCDMPTPMLAGHARVLDRLRPALVR